jgi:S1-C subfamily serine protease
VVDGSPAAAAGFKRRDIIVSYNGTALHQHDELPLLVANTPIGSDNH